MLSVTIYLLANELVLLFAFRCCTHLLFDICTYVLTIGFTIYFFLIH